MQSWIVYCYVGVASSGCSHPDEQVAVISFVWPRCNNGGEGRPQGRVAG